jgi:outer membrane protein TolC
MIQVEFLLKRKTILLFLVLLFVSSSHAQDSIPTVNASNPFKLILPKIDVLVEAAWAKHGMVKAREAEIEARKSMLRSARRSWTRNLGLQGDYRYGTFANFSENVTSASTINLASNTTQVNFGVGFFLKIPLFDLYNRNNEIKQAKAEVSQSESVLEFQKFEVKELVIRQYEDLILKQNLLELRIKNLANAKASIRMAENEYKNGIIPIYEYVRVIDIVARMEADFEMSRSEFVTSKKVLENLTGLTFN